MGRVVPAVARAADILDLFLTDADASVVATSIYRWRSKTPPGIKPKPFEIVSVSVPELDSFPKALAPEYGSFP